ncbi:hypothetical protein NP233_g4483 [Leucocoprinus birnbaumii]|uniref:Cyclopropane-fatty-acyl-phospholipid synthase n=1 Tax=Leucocoprinus birnbaumii TaxID=56174 RepID=A0AAD5YST2_9AGAR|nr:hypothetical protein NP233_g4483 [Leucocoprinus birnbaumii]
MWSTLTSSTVQRSWGILTSYAESTVVSLLQKITVGQLRVITLSNAYTFPLGSRADHAHEDSSLNAELRVLNDMFWIRLYLWVLHFAPNVIIDIAFTRITSCHVEQDTKKLDTSAVSDELYEAQMRKLDFIIRKAQIKEGCRVLDIGSGWGSLAIRIAQKIPGTIIDAITLSSEQLDLARERIEATGLSDRIRVHLMDYRCLPCEWAGVFDRVISLGMMEHVGEGNYKTYWGVIDWALKKETGVGVVQVSTTPEGRWASHRNSPSFIQKWPSFVIQFSTNQAHGPTLLVFPGGTLPPLTTALETLRSGSNGGLIVDSIHNVGPHYAKTLREWRRRFDRQFNDDIVPALRAEYPTTMGDGCGEQAKKEIDVFRRKWIYYFSYCEVGFKMRFMGDHIITFTRAGYTDFVCDLSA